MFSNQRIIITSNCFHIFQACRDVSRGSEAAERIRNLTGNPNVQCLKLNLVKKIFTDGCFFFV
jgi:hypothetical protein